MWANGRSIIETISGGAEAQMMSNTYDSNITIGKRNTAPLAANEYHSHPQQQLQMQQQAQQRQQAQKAGEPSFASYDQQFGPDRIRGEELHPPHAHPHSPQMNPAQRMPHQQFPSYYPTEYRQDRPMALGYYPNHQLGNNHQFPYYSQYSSQNRGGYGYPYSQRQRFAHSYNPYYGRGGIAPAPSLPQQVETKKRNLRNWFGRWFNL